MSVRTFLSILLFCLAQSGISQPLFILKDSTQTYRIDDEIEVLIDSTQKLTLHDILKSETNRYFVKRGNLVFGYEPNPIWLRINTKSLSPGTNWYLEIPAPFLEHLDFYQLEKNEWIHSVSGYYRKQSERIIQHTSHVVPLHFQGDSTNSLLIRIAGKSPKTFPVFIVEKDRFNQAQRLEDLGYGIFFGILVVMFFYNLVLFASLRQINYLLYVCTIICTFFIFSSASGYASQFLWPEMPILNYYAGRLILGPFVIFLSVFAIRFLEVRQYSKMLYYALMSLIPLAVGATLFMVTGLVSSAGNNLITISVILFMITGVVCRIMGNRTAIYYVAAWTIYLFGGLMLTLRNSGVFDFNFWTTHFVEIGAALETIIIALALGSRYRRYKEEHEAVQLLALKLQQETNERLEQKVTERTKQLTLAYEELNSTLQTNKQQTKIIEDKNAELDAFFYRISHDLRGPISSLLGLCYLAKQEITEARAKEYLDRQHEQVGRLSHIINGLINLTKLNQSDLPQELIYFDRLVDECIHSFQELPNFKNVAFKKDIQPLLEFHSEWILINAILQNLIENSIKYSRKEAPFVEIKVYQEGTELIIKVTDNGQGIHFEHQDKIFEMFFRASNRANGTGLGLYILKRSVDRLGGSIYVESTIEIGSSFTIKIPYKNSI